MLKLAIYEVRFCQLCCVGANSLTYKEENMFEEKENVDFIIHASLLHKDSTQIALCLLFIDVIIT